MKNVTMMFAAMFTMAILIGSCATSTGTDARIKTLNIDIPCETTECQDTTFLRQVFDVFVASYCEGEKSSCRKKTIKQLQSLCEIYLSYSDEFVCALITQGNCTEDAMYKTRVEKSFCRMVMSI